MAGDASWGRTGSGRKRPRTLQPRRSARPWAPSEETSVATCLVTFAEIGKPRGFALLGSDRGWNPFLSPALPPGRGRCRLPVRGQWRPPLWPLCRTPDAAPGRGQRARAQCRLAPNGAARAPPPSRGGGVGVGQGTARPWHWDPSDPGSPAQRPAWFPGAPRPLGLLPVPPVPARTVLPRKAQSDRVDAVRTRQASPCAGAASRLSRTSLCYCPQGARRRRHSHEPRLLLPAPPPPLLHAARALAGETSSSLCFYDWVVSS